MEQTLLQKKQGRWERFTTWSILKNFNIINGRKTFKVERLQLRESGTTFKFPQHQMYVTANTQTPVTQ